MTHIESAFSQSKWRQRSLRADSTDSLKRSEVPPPVESAHQRRKACLRSRAVPRLEEPNFIGRERFYCYLAIHDGATGTTTWQEWDEEGFQEAWKLACCTLNVDRFNNEQKNAL